jgi:hypothetical protein
MKNNWISFQEIMTDFIENLRGGWGDVHELRIAIFIQKVH